MKVKETILSKVDEIYDEIQLEILGILCAAKKKLEDSKEAADEYLEEQILILTQDIEIKDAKIIELPTDQSKIVL